MSEIRSLSVTEEDIAELEAVLLILGFEREVFTEARPKYRGDEAYHTALKNTITAITEE